MTETKMAGRPDGDPLVESSAPSEEPGRKGWSRRRLLAAGGGVVGAAVAGGLGYAVGRTGADDAAPEQAAAEPADNLRRFVSRPDLRLQPVTITTPATGTAGGLVFVTPSQGKGMYGPMIVDNTGEPVWFRQVPAPATVAIDLKVQTYQGKPVLTWWEGLIGGTGGLGIGQGEFVMADTAYREIRRIRANGITQADQHDLLITPEGTAIFWVYQPVSADLTALGGPKDGALHEGVIQEIDIATGRLLFEWRANDHVTLAESYAPLPQGEQAHQPYDFFHPNSVAVDTDGHLLASARHTWTIYKIHRQTGRVLWRLGGKRSDFTVGAGANFSWQHDARRRGDGTLGLFDNAAGITTEGEQSQGLVLRLDEQARTASLVRQFTHPAKLLAPTQGNMQELPDGGSFIGWGQLPNFTEYGPDGAVRFDGSLAADSQSYRAYRMPWRAQPADQPAVGTQRENGQLRLYASWNGATEVASWRVLGGQQPDKLTQLAEAPRAGFETVLTVPGDPDFLRADAVDTDGKPLGSSAVVPVRS